MPSLVMVMIDALMMVMDALMMVPYPVRWMMMSDGWKLV